MELQNTSFGLGPVISSLALGSIRPCRKLSAVMNVTLSND